MLYTYLKYLCARVFCWLKAFGLILNFEISILLGNLSVSAHSKSMRGHGDQLHCINTHEPYAASEPSPLVKPQSGCFRFKWFTFDH